MTEPESGALATRSIRLPAQPERYPELVDAVEAFGRASGIDQRPGWHEFLTAIAEIGANVLTYAYEGGEHGDMEMGLRLYPDRVQATFRDWGAPFVEPPAAAVAVDDDLFDPLPGLAEGGRGLAIARLALDSLTYERQADRTNVWQLVKRLSPD